MTTVIPFFNDDMYPYKRKQLVQNVLREPVLATLDQHGPMHTEGARYFLKRNYDIEIIGHAMRETFLYLASEGEVFVTMQPGQDAPDLYHLPGDTRQPSMPITYDYRDMFYDMYYRYKAIRENPGLATAPEYLIDEIYNPKRIN